MKRKIALLSALMSATLVGSPKITTSLTVVSKDIISRGFAISQDPYVMPQVMVSHGSHYIYTNHKSNLADGGSDRGSYTGLGTTVSNAFGSVNMELGQLSVPGHRNFREVYTAWSAKLPLNPTIEAVVATDSIKSATDFAGQYYAVALSKSVSKDAWSGTLKAKLGYNANYGVEYQDFTHLTFDASVKRKLKEYSLEAGLRVQKGLRSDVANDHAFHVKVTRGF